MSEIEVVPCACVNNFATICNAISCSIYTNEFHIITWRQYCSHLRHNSFGCHIMIYMFTGTLIASLSAVNICNRSYTKKSSWAMYSMVIFSKMPYETPHSLRYCRCVLLLYNVIYSMLPIYCGLSSPNNSWETPIAHPLGWGMGFFNEMIVWLNHYLWN